MGFFGAGSLLRLTENAASFVRVRSAQREITRPLGSAGSRKGGAGRGLQSCKFSHPQAHLTLVSLPPEKQGGTIKS